MKEILLASRSRRRKEVMDFSGLKSRIVVALVDDKVEDVSPLEEAQILAKRKCDYVHRQYPNDIVIGVVSVVNLEGKSLPKPKDEEHAKEILRLLSGKTHEVITACYLKYKDKVEYVDAVTEVTFADMSEDEIEYYVNTGEVFDKPGAYSAKGFGSRYIKKIDGDIYNTYGLPVYQVYSALKKLW